MAFVHRVAASGVAIVLVGGLASPATADTQLFGPVAVTGPEALYLGDRLPVTFVVDCNDQPAGSAFEIGVVWVSQDDRKKSQVSFGGGGFYDCADEPVELVAMLDSQFLVPGRATLRADVAIYPPNEDRAAGRPWTDDAQYGGTYEDEVRLRRCGRPTTPTPGARQVGGVSKVTRAADDPCPQVAR